MTVSRRAAEEFAAGVAGNKGEQSLALRSSLGVVKRSDYDVAVISGQGAGWGQFDGGAGIAKHRTDCAAWAAGSRQGNSVEKDHRALPHPAGFDWRSFAGTC